MKLINTYITKEDVEILDKISAILEDYAVKDDGDEETFVIDSFHRIVKDFKEADEV